jgi:hypothetical protein
MGEELHNMQSLFPQEEAETGMTVHHTLRARRVPFLWFTALALVIFLRLDQAGAQCVPPPANIVSWWKGEGDATDAIGTNNGSIQGGVTFAAGEVGEAFSFDGTTSSVIVPDSTSLEITNILSMEAWINVAATNSSQAVMTKYGGAGGAKGYEFYLVGNVLTAFFTSPGVGSNSKITAAIPIVPGTWSHVAFTYDQSAMTLYFNGQPVATNVIGPTNISASSSNFRIGANDGNKQLFSGEIDEAAVYNEALPAAAIADIYNAGAAGKCGAGTAPTIFTQPANEIAGAGNYASLDVSAGGFGTLTYQWFQGGAPVPGETNAVLSFPDAQFTNAGTYQVVVSNAWSFVTSSNATLTVGLSPTITSEPTNQAVAAGQTASFSVTATGTGTLSYQWLFNSNDVTNATNTLLTVTNVQSPQIGTYAVLVTSPYGSTISSNATLTFGVSPTVTNQPQNQMTGIDDTVSFSVGASGTPPLSYQWLLDDTNIPGATGAVLTLTNVQPAEGGTYSAIVTNVYGSTLSSNAVLTVEPPPTITDQPTNAFVVAGQTANFSVAATGTAPLSYQWLFDGTNISGAAGASLAVTNVQSLQLGAYAVVVSDEWGSTLSSNATLAIGVAPTITGQPQTQVVPIGSNANFSVSAGGTPPFSYQWIFNRVYMSGGATNPVLTITNVQSAQYGMYSVLVTSPFGSIRSGIAYLVEPEALINVNFAANPSEPEVGFAATGQLATDRWNAYGYGSGELTNLVYSDGSASPAGMTVDCATPPGDAGQWGIPSLLDFMYSSYMYVSPGYMVVTVTNLIPGVYSVYAYGHGDANNQNSVFDLSAEGVDYGTNSTVVGPGWDTTGWQEGMQYVEYTNVTITNPGTALTLTAFEDGAGYSILNGLQIASFSQTAPVIYAEPRSQVVPEGSASTFSVGAYGTPSLGYQWQLNGATLTGATNSTLAIESTDFTNAGSYTVVLTNAYGSLTSTNATLTVVPLIITNQPQGTTAYAAGAASFSAGVLGAGPLSYQWLFDGTNIPGGTNVPLVLSDVQPSQAGAYSVLVGNAYGSVLSSNATLTVAADLLLNIDFAANSSNPDSGFAAIGQTTNDYWNSYGNVDGMLGSLRYASGLSSPAWVTVTGAGSESSIPGLSDSMYSTYMYGSQTDMTVTLSGLPSGTYSICVYGHGDADNQNGIYDLSAGGVDYGTNSTVDGEGWDSTVWQEGMQYVVFTNVTVTNSAGTVTLTAYGDPGGYSILNGLQILSDNPGPPIITAQPQSQTVLAGGSSSFSSAAIGVLPFAYQWLFNGTNLNDATNDTLTITNPQADQAGDYELQVTGPYGVTTSSNAVLTVIVPVCDPPPPGLVGWWQGEGDGGDVTGTNNGTLQGGVTFTNGEAGRAFSFDGTSGTVVAPDSPSLEFTNQITIEAWINTPSTNDANPQSILSKIGGAGGNNGYQLFLSGSMLTAQFNSPGKSWPSSVISVPVPIVEGSWNHVAFTYDQLAMKLYFNGQAVATNPIGSAAIAASTSRFHISGDDNYGATYFDGGIDEASVYNRALSEAEITGIYEAGSAGKCGQAPVITSQPQNQTANAGRPAVLSVAAGGTRPFGYQWLFDSTNIPGATNNPLILTNVQRVNAGTYCVAVTNVLGSTLSSNATLTVGDVPPDLALINVDFAANPDDPEVGYAAFGKATNDYWNPYGYLGGGIANLDYSDGSVSPIGLIVGNGTGQWGITGLSDSMFSSYMYVDGGSVTVMLTNVPAGFYTFYIYGHGAADDQNGIYDLTAGNVDYGTESTVDGPGWNTDLWEEGMQYAVFTNVLMTNPVGTVTLTASPSAGGYSMINGMQIVTTAGAGPPAIVVEPQSESAPTGSSIAISVTATGGIPMSYQWQLDSIPIPGATNATLAFTNFGTTNAGDYLVTVSNSLGGVVSSNAVLSVSSPIIRYVNAANITPAAPYTNWSTAATNIQDAVDVAASDDIVLVTNGVYQYDGATIGPSGPTISRVAVTIPITVESVNGPAVTFIQGLQLPGEPYIGPVRCAYLGDGAVLSGFTLTNGATSVEDGLGCNCDSGGAVYCASTNALITNCVLVNNGANYSGGGAYYGTLVNCTLIGNNSPDGGGAYGSLLLNCTVASNVVSAGGGVAGGVDRCTLTGCLVIANSVNTGGSYGGYALGGGAYQSALNDCKIISNSANLLGGPPATVAGGGVYQCSLTNSLLMGNSSSGSGGGAFGGTLENCTVVANSAGARAGGVSQAALYDTIVSDCGAPTNADYDAASTLVYCCTTPLPPGAGNITNAPLFVNTNTGDYHLQATSPCINAGQNSYVNSTTDLDGNQRISGGTVDMGAYEFQNPASIISYAWLEEYSLPTDGSADNADTDGTGMSNWGKWRAGLNPTNPASVLRMVTVTNVPNGRAVTWQSISGITYFLQLSTNLQSEAAFISIQSNIAGQAGTTTVTDTNAPGPWFYRVGVQ